MKTYSMSTMAVIRLAVAECRRLGDYMSHFPILANESARQDSLAKAHQVLGQLHERHPDDVSLYYMVHG